MDIDKARKTLAFLKKHKMGAGDDLSVFVKGAEEIQNRMFTCVAFSFYGLFIIVEHTGKLRPLFFITGLFLFVAALFTAKRYQRKVAKIRDYMIDHKAFYLTEFDQKKDANSSPESSLVSR